MTQILRGAVVAAFLMLLAAAPALAHSELEESDPVDGATITTPYTLTATFSEEFDPARSFIRVESVTGEIVAEGQQDPNNDTVMTASIPSLDPGEYTVRWQTTTPDDNGVERGSFVFDVAGTAPATARPAATPTPAPTPTGNGGQSGSSIDILLALVLAAIVLIGLGAYLFAHRR